jgi:hypothetical protein
MKGVQALDEIRFIAATGALGVGVDEASLFEALDIEPHFIAADAGSTDAGPFALGSGRAAFGREAIMRDLSLMLRAGAQAKIPVLIGSAATAGADVHVDWVLDIVRDIATSAALDLKVAVIKSEQEPATIAQWFADGRIEPLDPAPAADRESIERNERIVAMMGVEPLQAALAQGVDFVLAGRCSDPALFAAMPIMKGFPAGLAWHAGKIVECGTLACETSGKGVITGTIRHHEAIIRPIGTGLRCTPQSVAAHSLYENGDPYLHKECSGMLDLSECVFEQIDDVSVRVTGSQFHVADQKTVKLEGAEMVGYQSLIIGGIRDPFIIRQLDSWLAKVEGYIRGTVKTLLGKALAEVGGDYSLKFHVYGKNAVMGPIETDHTHVPLEVGIVAEATAPTQALATRIAQLCRQPLLHAPIDEWKGAITGFACLHNPAEIERGAVYRFSLNHVALVDDPVAMFRTEYVAIDGAAACAA